MLLRWISVLALAARVLTGGDSVAAARPAGLTPGPAAAAPAVALTPGIATPGPAAPKLDTALVNFFVGEWKGEGHFSNGKPIASTLSFHLSLDSAWLVSEHRDIPPMDYKATGWWGVDANTKQFVAIVFDNYQGHRSFASRGWSGGKLTLTTESYAPGVGTYFEHFIYERLSDNQFKMTYETSADAITWRLGDSLVFVRKSA